MIRSCLTLLSPLLLLAACSQAGEESRGAALSFGAQTQPLVWALDEDARALALAPVEETSPPMVVLFCDGAGQGGIRTRAFTIEPSLTMLELTLGETRFSAAGRAVQSEGRTVLEGRGPLPQGWTANLSRAETLKLQYGDQGATVQGPDSALATQFDRVCQPG